ncbi:hypothetical protein HS960_10595 [Sphingobacterium paramultivorum]|uniref:Mce/MlaD domain-containing protein n=1 Tax=Sphingobacterium paramultivorum TaxID=2886510 RepID=A0A7G5E256_9SPHI|nr:MULTISPECIES: hypothetical protein [Sphingobacterium]QMV68081.1 hypothetical protein HS960_10595 [Sphingobacterium paramultivorum]WSO16987.1 hypothetical protein VUL84_10580 [Sphingobacterium paramultivorum]
MRYSSAKIILIVAVLLIGCDFGREKQYFLEFREEQKIAFMPNDIYLGDQKIGTVDQVLLKSTVPTFKVTLSDPIPIHSTVELTEIDLLGTHRLFLKKSNSEKTYHEDDTVIGLLKYIKQQNMDPKLRDSIYKSIREGNGILQFDRD